MQAFPMIDNPNPYALAAARRCGVPLAIRRSGQNRQGDAWFGIFYLVENPHANKDGAPALPTGAVHYQPN